MEFAQPESVGLSGERLARIDAVMQGYVDRSQVAGMSTLVARRGRVAHVSHFGRADIENDHPVTSDTIWRVYSMTKPITAAAALMLFERGLYGLNDPISAYIPALRTPRCWWASATRAHRQYRPHARSLSGTCFATRLA